MASLREEDLIRATTSWSLDAHHLRYPRHIHHSSEQETTMTQLSGICAPHPPQQPC
jgi:hypothetical protein